MAKAHDRSMHIEAFVLVLVTAGILLAIAVATLVGRATARLFFHASRGHGDEVADRTHEVRAEREEVAVRSN